MGNILKIDQQQQNHCHGHEINVKLEGTQISSQELFTFKINGDLLCVFPTNLENLQRLDLSSLAK